MPSIADLIEQHRERLIQRYIEEASRLPSARDVRPQDVLDNCPEYLDTLCALSRGQCGDPGHTRRRLEETHIGLRLRLGYTLDDATAEFVLLGRLLSSLWEPLPPGQQPTPEDIQRLFDELQAALEHTISVFSGYSLEDRQTEKRALRRMDALAADLLSAIEPPVSLDERLGLLLAVVQEFLHADAATLLLVEPDGQRLLPTASSGLWLSPPDPTSIPVRSPSFVAEVASSPEVLHLPDATTTRLVLGEGVRASGIHSLLGLRMWPRGQLLGVVYLGITESRPFEPRARRLLEMLVEHLCGIIDRVHLLQQLRQAQARLRESEPRRPTPSGPEAPHLSEERLRLAVESTGLGTWDLDPLTGALLWDERCKALFGLPPDAAVDYDTFLALVHPEDRERVQRVVRQALDPTGSGAYRLEYRSVAPRDGLVRWLSTYGRAFFDANGRAVRFIGTALDITERIREREAVEREKNRVTTLLESISEAFEAFDREWRFTYVNREAERLVGKPREELLGRNHWELYPDTVGTALEHHYRRVAAERIPLAFENYYAPWDRWFELRVHPTEEGVAVFFQDVTERKRRDEERERLLREQTHLREQAEKALRERQRAEQFRERLMGIVSHDLRNPLHSISLTTELLLRREDVPEPVLAGVRRIARSVDRMSRMITDLLDFTRARLGGGIPLQRQPGNLVELVRATLEEFEVMHPGRVVLSHDPGPYAGEWDPDRLAQVVSNLVGNALQHGAGNTPVEVALSQEGPSLVLTVRNQGTPIPETLLPQVFDPFRRSADSTRQGLGLGLYIVQQIVLAHGGSISVSSSADSGTTFTVRLPRVPTRP
ncbi:ATP-binding protein [Archangium sp.]|uniref:sensor histidine kinase n=1 Tax=Archangium sp. TaxID=1872627 RepID=UPI002D48FE15|nr:ATP-binding protein [Archangium sp.]HYO52571.1 ATP-binding protein [Archangium sp.]